jgi:hypothetical protein
MLSLSRFRPPTEKDGLPARQRLSRLVALALCGVAAPWLAARPMPVFRWCSRPSASTPPSHWN